LQHHIELEADARRRNDKRAIVRLSGEFHVLLAELSGSSIYHRMMRELTPLTCLAILTFEAPTAAACPNDEHTRLIDAIEAGNATKAAALMTDHLHHIENALDLNRRDEEPEVDLEALLLG
jgi:DNA-binding GntR family transcriptional regulator